MLSFFELKDRIKKNKAAAFIIKKTKRFSMLGFDKVPLYYVVRFLASALFNGSLSRRAASVSFSFFLAIFPGIIFLFTLIPIIPVDGFQETLLLQLDEVLPAGIKEITHDTIVDLISTKRGGLLSFNFFLALLFATNGIFSLTDEFNNTALFNEKRNYFKQRLIAVGLFGILTVLLLTAIALVIFSGQFIGYLLLEGYVTKGLELYLVYAADWLSIFLLYYFAISFLYYLGPAKRKTWQFFSPGSSLATILMIITSVLFSYYVNNLNQYNKIYGSIGTILIVMLWININSFVLLIGFELNASVKKARMEGKILPRKRKVSLSN
ncbi:MAG: membrane protein [Saprospiraceae bacterium]|jgi:membrane protein